MELFWVLVALVHVFALAFLFYKQQPKRKPPPGPKPWPIIGNLNLAGALPHRSFHLLSQKYGDIMQLRFGKYPVVVASSPEMAENFLRMNDAAVASRPPLAAGKYLNYNYQTMTWASYGPYFVQARKIYLNEVFKAKKLEFYDHIRVSELHSFLSRLHSISGKPTVLKHHLSRHTLTTMCRMVLGNKYFSESEDDDGKCIVSMDELTRMMDEWFFLNGVVKIGDWIPWLSFFDLEGYVKRMKALAKKWDMFHNYVIDDHQARRAAQKDFVAKDVVDALLELAEDPNLDVKLTRDCIKALIQDLLLGGTDTSSTTIEWAIYDLLKHPHVFEKAKEELDRVVGRSRWVEENDFSQLPYIEAILMESMRIHPLVPFLSSRAAAEDCKVAGYDISKGTMVLINVWTIGRDPKLWDKPLEFLPERFLGKRIDTAATDFTLMPFGSGRRRCPGYNLGLKFVRSMLANLLHGFEFRLCEGMKPEDVCMDEEFGLTTHPKVPMSIIVEPTLPSHLY